MEISKIRLVYFSPTGTTQKVLKDIAQGLGVDDVESINLTLARGGGAGHCSLYRRAGHPGRAGLRRPGSRPRPWSASKNSRGTGPWPCRWCSTATGSSRTPCWSSRIWPVELGFKPVAAAAFIGEYSFATEALPIAMGRLGQ